MTKTETAKPVGKPSEITAPARATWLTARTSEAFGPKGRFLSLTAEEAASADEGVLIRPTAEQLAQR